MVKGETFSWPLKKIFGFPGPRTQWLGDRVSYRKVCLRKVALWKFGKYGYARLCLPLQQIQYPTGRDVQEIICPLHFSPDQLSVTDH